MSNSEVFGSPMILNGRYAGSPFGAAPSASFHESAAGQARRWLAKAMAQLFQRSDEQRRIRQTVVELSRLEDHMLRDIGLDRSAIISAAHDIEKPRRFGSRRQRR